MCRSSCDAISVDKVCRVRIIPTRSSSFAFGTAGSIGGNKTCRRSAPSSVAVATAHGERKRDARRNCAVTFMSEREV